MYTGPLYFVRTSHLRTIVVIVVNVVVTVTTLNNHRCIRSCLLQVRICWTTSNFNNTPFWRRKYLNVMLFRHYIEQNIFASYWHRLTAESWPGGGDRNVEWTGAIASRFHPHHLKSLFKWFFESHQHEKSIPIYYQTVVLSASWKPWTWGWAADEKINSNNNHNQKFYKN